MRATPKKSSSCPCKTTLPIFKGFPHDRARQRSMEQNVEDPVEIKVPKILSQESVEAVKKCLPGANFRRKREQIQGYPRPQARTECCSAQSSRLSTSLVSRMNEYNVLPNLISMAKSWTPCSQSERAFGDHIASLECDAEYEENVAEKEWLGLMPLLRNSLSEMKEQLALALKRA